MSYNIAYTSQFGDPEGLLWNVEIYRDGFTGTPAEIGLDGEQPVIIEWQETKLQDAVCPSQCTLKVVNGSDRQMVPLAIDDYAYIKVYRDGKLYWTGVLDQGIYEEPYSYNDDYITEITCSDFGALNRFDFHPFSQSGRSDYIVSLKDIVDVARSLIVLDGVGMAQNVSMQLPGSGGNTAHLHHLYVNSRRFEGMTYRDVLEETLRPFGYRIIQKNGGVWVYDAEWMFGNATVKPTVWMGDDAKLSFGNVYGKLALTFNRDSRPVIADGTIDPDDKGFAESSRFYAVYREEYNDSSIWDYLTGFIDYIIGTDDPDRTFWGAAFFIDGIAPAFSGKKPVNILQECKPVRLRGKYASVHDAILARRIRCYDQTNQEYRDLLETNTPKNINDVDGIFSLESVFIPTVIDTKRYQLRVNLDILFSPRINFHDNDDHGDLDNERWKHWEKKAHRFAVPVILELLDSVGNPVMHYKNTWIPYNDKWTLSDPGQGSWIDGPGFFGEMSLLYYTDGLEDNPLLNGWAGNRQSISLNNDRLLNAYQKRKDGEYIPLPPVNGRLKMTVGNGIMLLEQTYSLYDKEVWWQLYRNPTITIVKKHEIDDDVDNMEVSEKKTFSIFKDSFSEDSAIGTMQDGVSPACLGLLMKSDGEAYDGFVKNGVKQSLLRHRLNSLEDQLATPHSVLSGTAALTTVMCVRSDASTGGKFLMTALRQNPHEGTEEVVMTRISPGGDRYSFAWSGGVCATEEERYRHQWSDPVCLKVPEHYSFVWSDGVCARVSVAVMVWHYF